MPRGYAAIIGTLATSGKDAPHKHGCPGCCGGNHIVTGPISTGCPTVFFEKAYAARGTDQGHHAACCMPGPQEFLIIAATCSQTVFIGNLPAARAGDQTLHCGMCPGKIEEASCCQTVSIG